MHIKIGDLVFTNIERKNYKVIPRNVYAQAKRTRGKSLKMIKVRLGTVYDIKVTIFDLDKNNASDLQKEILKPEIDIEFYDTYSKEYKTQNCYCQDAELAIKRSFKDDTNILYEPLQLNITANQAADWVVV